MNARTAVQSLTRKTRPTRVALRTLGIDVEPLVDAAMELADGLRDTARRAPRAEPPRAEPPGPPGVVESTGLGSLGTKGIGSGADGYGGCGAKPTHVYLPRSR